VLAQQAREVQEGAGMLELLLRCSWRLCARMRALLGRSACCGYAQGLAAALLLRVLAGMLLLRGTVLVATAGTHTQQWQHQGSVCSCVQDK
jgi:hypothetical protein